jgi:hypothetical protein
VDAVGGTTDAVITQGGGGGGASEDALVATGRAAPASARRLLGAGGGGGGEGEAYWRVQYEAACGERDEMSARLVTVLEPSSRFRPPGTISECESL